MRWDVTEGYTGESYSEQNMTRKKSESFGTMEAGAEAPG